MSVLRSPTRGVYAALAAAGTTQATAAEITADSVMVTTSTAASAEGVILPPGNLDDEVRVVNGTSNTIFVYPRSGGKLNNATADQPLNLPPNQAAHFVGINNVDWAAFF